VNFVDKTVLDAQADGLACVYCGRSSRRDGTLAPLRSSARASSHSHESGGFVVISQTSTGRQVFRCDPPCQRARLAYNDTDEG